jgi:hypothetical protein
LPACPARHDRVRERDPDDAGRDDRRDAARRRLDPPRDDALPLPLERASTRSRAARVRADQPAGDLRPAPGNSFVEFLLGEGFDVFLVDWGVPDEEDADMGLAEFVCDELHWAVRETLRRGADELTLLGWCIGGTLCAMYCALHPGGRGAQRGAADDADRPRGSPTRAGSAATTSTSI